MAVSEYVRILRHIYGGLIYYDSYTRDSSTTIHIRGTQIRAGGGGGRMSVGIYHRLLDKEDDEREVVGRDRRVQGGT